MTKGVHPAPAAERPGAVFLRQYGSVSLEGRFVLAEGPPLFDRLVGEPFCAGLDRLDRDLVQQAKYLRSDAVGYAKDTLEAACRQNARLTQRKVTDDGKDELLEIVIRLPTRQGDDVEASRKLNVAVDRLALP